MNPADKFCVSDLLTEQTETKIEKVQSYPSAPYFSKPVFHKFFWSHYKTYALIFLLYMALSSALLAYQIWSNQNKTTLRLQFSKEFENKWNVAFEEKEALRYLSTNLNSDSVKKISQKNADAYEITVNTKTNSAQSFGEKLENDVSQKLDTKILAIQSGLESIKKDITKAVPVTTEQFYQEKTQNDIRQFIHYGNHWNELRHKYFQQVLKINEIARHNTVHVFKLKEKDIFSPFTAEYEMLSKSVIDINNPDIQTKLEALKAEHETYLKTIMQKELDELEEKQLSPARQLLITEEKTLRSLWFEMETVRGLYLQSKRELENSNDALLYEKQLKHMLASTKSLLLDLEKTMQAKYTPANVWGQFEKLHSRNDQKGFTVMVGGMALALLLAGAFFWQYHHYLQQPRIHSLAGLEQQTGKRASFHLNENLLDSITDENAKYFEYIKQKASFFHRIDRHCGVILVNTLDPKATSFWCKLIASTGVRVCWLAQREIEDFLLKEYTLHQTMHQGLSAHLQKKINLPSAVYATNFQNLFVSPMDAKSRLPKTPDFSALKTSIDEKFDYLIVNSHPHQIKKHYQYFAEQVEYQINCVFEDTTLVAELFLDAEKKHPNTQILNAFFSGRSG